MLSPNDNASTTPPHPPPVAVPSSPRSIQAFNTTGSPISRQASTARLASPVQLKGTNFSTPIDPSTNQLGAQSSGDQTPLAGAPSVSLLPGTGISTLAMALSKTFGQSPPQFGTPPHRSVSPAQAQVESQSPFSNLQSNNEPLDRGRSIQGAPGLAGANISEDPEIVKRHLVQPSEAFPNDSLPATVSCQPKTTCKGAIPGGNLKQFSGSTPNNDEDEFSSLQLQGGDVTRPIYKWTEEAEARAQGRGRQGRSQSFHLSRPQPENEILDIGTIKVPGGFRRNFIRRIAMGRSGGYNDERGVSNRVGQGRIFTNNFIEFLTIYGHFAGEELEEDDEALEQDGFFASEEQFDEDDDENGGPTEESALLSSGRRKRKERRTQGTNSVIGAALLLLKSFVGTGVLFLPKAYLNGGMLFSNLVLLIVAGLSYYCFVLLIETRLKVERSYGDIGGVLYGNWFRITILISIVVSQLGFAAAYIVFTSENLQAFILAVSHCKTFISTPWLILMQMVVFLPFSLLRDISKLGLTAFIADAFILFGLLVLYYYDIDTLLRQGGVADIVQFNSIDWTLFIGTAIFTFEGIGLIIPIQESMKNPKQFPAVLGGVMVIIVFVFLSIGAISYAAYGSKTETVIILNLPQDKKLVNGVQFLYSMAILLSTPLQIFPAIRITENELFTRSGKHNTYIKWKKNGFRFLVVILCAVVAWLGANDLDKFVSLVGSIACIPLVFIYPPMLHIRSVSGSRFRVWTDISLCCFGLIVMIYTTSLTIKSWAGASVPVPPRFCDSGNIGSYPS
ncbi:Vacuolar amino acid transporter 3 [Podosphaera aphanis]|nr:Vacuolar amino acid transporter 3 [Podosphaera aphanis]